MLKLEVRSQPILDSRCKDFGLTPTTLALFEARPLGLAVRSPGTGLETVESKLLY